MWDALWMWWETLNMITLSIWKHDDTHSVWWHALNVRRTLNVMRHTQYDNTLNMKIWGHTLSMMTYTQCDDALWMWWVTPNMITLSKWMHDDAHSVWWHTLYMMTRNAGATNQTRRVTSSLMSQTHTVIYMYIDIYRYICGYIYRYRYEWAVSLVRWTYTSICISQCHDTQWWWHQVNAKSRVMRLCLEAQIHI